MNDDLNKVNELITTLDDTVQRSGNINEMLKNSKNIVDDLNNLKNKIYEVEIKINDVINNLNYSVDYNRRYLNDIREDFIKKSELNSRLDALEDKLNKKKEMDEKHKKVFFGLSVLMILLLLLNLLLK